MEKNEYVVINTTKFKRTTDQKNQEIVVSSTEANIQGNHAVIIITNECRLKIYNLADLSEISVM